MFVAVCVGAGVWIRVDVVVKVAAATLAGVGVAATSATITGEGVTIASTVGGEPEVHAARKRSRL